MRFLPHRASAHLAVRTAALFRRTAAAQACPHASHRCLLTSSLISRAAPPLPFAQHRAGNTGTGTAAADRTAADMSEFGDIEDRLFSLQALHIRGDAADPAIQRLELEAWELLQSIPEDAVDRLPTTTVAEVIQTYHYFCRFWERGVDGPATASASGFAAPPGASAKATDAHPDGRKPLVYPILHRPRGDEVPQPTPLSTQPFSKLEAADRSFTVARANPLDQILDF